MKMKKIYSSIKNYYFEYERKKYQIRLSNRFNSCGENFNIFGKVDIINPGNITIGNDCSMNHGAYVNAFNSIKIGNDVTISAGVKIISTGIDVESWANGKKQHLTEKQNIKIGNHTWIGAGAQILGGVSINGEYVVIAAGAVVVDDINENRCIVAGIPAKIIKRF